MVAWFGADASYGQSIYSGLKAPVQVLQTTTANQQMFAAPGYVPSGTQTDPLANYRRSRLGRWDVAKEVDPDDSGFGIEITTPAGPIRIRFETTIDGKSFRATREKTIDELLAIAKGDLKRDAATVVKNVAPEEVTDKEEETEQDVKEEPEASADATEVKAEVKVESDAENETVKKYFTASAKDRMVAYAKARGDRLTRPELRRRVADIAGGPSLLRTTNDFGAQRHQTMTLFAFLDKDEDGAISPQESKVAIRALLNRDVNSDGQTTWSELQKGLKSRTTQRKTGPIAVDWQSWDSSDSKFRDDIRVSISFDDAADDSGLIIDECRLDGHWEMVEAQVRRPNADSTHGSIVLATHPKFSLALSSATANSNGTGQVSIGVALGSNALFRSLDQDGDWSLSTAECDAWKQVFKSLDANADGTLAANELPVLLRVCVSRGATAHEALADNVSIVRETDEEKNQLQQAAPDWFASMDHDGTRTLTRKEFLGNRKSFDKIDTDQDDLLSIEEVLAAEPD